MGVEVTFEEMTVPLSAPASGTEEYDCAGTRAAAARAMGGDARVAGLKEKCHVPQPV